MRLSRRMLVTSRFATGHFGHLHVVHLGREQDRIFPVSEQRPIRVCVVGAESSGTTTLCQDLAAHYETVWVPEYGRLYTERLREKGINTFSYHWRSEEFVHIALQQQEDEDRLAADASRVLVCDTDALATCIWHQRYLGTWSKKWKKSRTAVVMRFTCLQIATFPSSLTGSGMGSTSVHG